MVAEMLLALVVAAPGTPVQGVICGGVRASTGMTLGKAAISTTLHARTLVAVLPIVLDGSNTPQGWIGTDDLGNPWIAFADPKGTLRQLYQAEIPALFSGTFTPIPGGIVRLPPGYSVVPCSRVGRPA